MRVHLVDGTYELFRSYYGAPPARGPTGAEVGAVRGLLRSMLALFDGERREGREPHVAIAFDTVIESFRNELFPGYKTGAGIEPNLLAQFDLAERACRALGCVTWSMIEFEADDALATAAARFGADPSVSEVYLCSPDKDLAQCVAGKVRLWDRRRETLFDQAGVEAKFGVLPVSIPDYLALVGDAADGIPGIPRWGAKGAAAVLAKWSHIEAIPPDSRHWQVKVRGAEALAQSLQAHRSDALLYRTLATLRTDVPLDEAIGDLRWAGVRLPDFAAIAEELGDTALASRATGAR